jgi:hypothetical protein
VRRPPRTAVIALALVAVVVLGGLPIVWLTESSLERSLKETLGYSTTCQPTIDQSSPWQPGPPMASPRDELRAVAVAGHIYLVGGVTGIQQLESGGVRVNEIATFTRFDPGAGTYAELEPMPEPGNHVGTVAYQGAIYVLGGFPPRLDQPAKARFSRYLLAEGRWEELPPMPVPRGAMAVGVVDGRLIVAGGASADREIRRVDAYDFRTRSWSRLADMPRAREHTGGAVVEGKLYVIGGRDAGSDALDTVARYDPRTDRWERLPPLPVPSGGLDTVVIDETVVAVGGGNDRAGTVTGAVQRFDPRTGRWSRLADLRTPRHGHGAAVAGEGLWVLGGSPCAYYAATDLVEWLSFMEVRESPSRARPTR